MASWWLPQGQAPEATGVLEAVTMARVKEHLEARGILQE